MDHGSWFMVTWAIFKNHLLKVGLTQNRETMALRTLTIVGLFCFMICEDSAWIEIHWNSIWLRTRSHMTSHYTWGTLTTLHDFEGVLGWPLDTFFRALNFVVMALGLWVKWPLVMCLWACENGRPWHSGMFTIVGLFFLWYVRTPHE